MPVPHNLALLGMVFWNSYTFSFQHDSPVPMSMKHLFAKLPKLQESEVQLQGQTVLITGANAGIGLETARSCVKFGAERIIFGVRNLAKGEAAKKEILTGGKDENFTTQIDVWQLDQEDFESVVQFGRRVNEDLKESGKRLDYAILNAGIWNYRYHQAKTGYEMCLQVNTLGCALLSLLLLPALSSSSPSSRDPARLAFATSETYAWTDLKRGVHSDLFAHASNPKRYKGCRAYHLSKLLLMFWSRELACRVDPSKVVVGDTTPGLCQTAIIHVPARSAWFNNLILKLTSHSAEDGAIMYIRSIFLSREEDFHDGYFVWGKPSKWSTYIRSERGRKAQKEIWRQIITLFHGHVPDLDVSCLE